jgi:type III secretion system FlhB-like substrate exporter
MEKDSGGEYDDEIIEIAESRGVELEEAQEISDLMDELGVDEDDAQMIQEEM